MGDSGLTDRQCWICLAGSSSLEWVSPCRCKGSAQWVHKRCLLRWVDEKQRGNAFLRIYCPQCLCLYKLYTPPLATVPQILEYVDRFMNMLCLLFCSICFMILFGFICAFYGLFTLVQILGLDETIDTLQKSNLAELIVNLQFIPTALIYFKMIPTEDILFFFYLVVYVPIRNFFGFNKDPNFKDLSYEVYILRKDVSPFRDRHSMYRNFIGGLILPTIACTFGKVFFWPVENKMERALYGGLLYICIRIIFKLYLIYKQYICLKMRRAINMNEENMS